MLKRWGCVLLDKGYFFCCYEKWCPWIHGIDNNGILQVSCLIIPLQIKHFRASFTRKLYILSLTLMFFCFSVKKARLIGSPGEFIRNQLSQSLVVGGGDKALCYSVFMVISIILMNPSKQLDWVCVPPYISLYVCLSIKSNHITWYHFSLSIFPCELFY